MGSTNLIGTKVEYVVYKQAKEPDRGQELLSGIQETIEQVRKVCEVKPLNGRMLRFYLRFLWDESHSGCMWVRGTIVVISTRSGNHKDVQLYRALSTPLMALINEKFCG